MKFAEFFSPSFSPNIFSLEIVTKKKKKKKKKSNKRKREKWKGKEKKFTFILFLLYGFKLFIFKLLLYVFTTAYIYENAMEKLLEMSGEQFYNFTNNVD